MVAEEGLEPRHADYDSASNQLSYSAWSLSTKLLDGLSYDDRAIRSSPTI